MELVMAKPSEDRRYGLIFSVSATPTLAPRFTFQNGSDSFANRTITTEGI